MLATIDFLIFSLSCDRYQSLDLWPLQSLKWGSEVLLFSSKWELLHLVLAIFIFTSILWSYLEVLLFLNRTLTFFP